MGEGIGQMIKAVAYKPKTFGAVSLSVKPDTMTWMMKRERICALCNDFIGREQFWKCKKCKEIYCTDCEERGRSCSNTKRHKTKII